MSSTNNTEYTTNYSDGREESHDSLPKALAALRSEYPEMYAMHEVGQIDDSDDDTRIEHEKDGHRILVWETEGESADDAGARCVASVRRA